MKTITKIPTHTGAVAGLALILALGGCFNNDTTVQDLSPFSVGNWRQLPKRAEIRVELVRLQHTTAFSTQAVLLDEAERGRLFGFVSQGSLGQSDQIVLRVPVEASGVRDPVTAARVDYLQNEFAVMGLPLQTSDVPLGLGQASDQLTVFVERAMAIPPDCSTDEPWVAHRPEVPVGCAFKSAIGMMAADPRDLVKGRTIGPADADSAARAVYGYRNPDQRNQDDGGLNEESTTE